MSGIAWAPTLPESWKHGRLRWLTEIYAGGTPDRETPEFWSDGTIPWLNSGSVNDWAIVEPSEYISEAGLARSSARWVPAKSVVIGLAGQGKTKGTSARLEIPSTTNQSMAAIVPRSELDYRFLHYWLVSNYQSIRNLAGGDKRDGLNLQHVAGIECPLPNTATQVAIADYLDRETAQIDTLIAKQEQLIATLRERFNAVVATLATRGLVEDAQTREVGVPWLGPINAAWTVTRVRHLADVGTGSGDTVDAEPGGEYPFYVRSQTPLRSTSFDHIGPAVLTAGDGAGVAKVFHLVVGQFKAHQRVYVIDNFRNILPEYFLAYFSSYFSYVALDGSAKSTVDSVRRPMIVDMPVPVPPLTEQRAITDRIAAERARVDHLIGKAEQFIALARERRSALITAAVTGQIDVSTAT